MAALGFFKGGVVNAGSRTYIYKFVSKKNLKNLLVQIVNFSAPVFTHIMQGKPLKIA